MTLAALRSKLARSLMATLKNTPAAAIAVRAPGQPLARSVVTASTRSQVASSPFLSAAGAASSLSPLRAGALHRAAFSTQVSKKEPTTLGEILADELQTEESLYHRDEILDNIPAGFELVESDGTSLPAPGGRASHSSCLLALHLSCVNTVPRNELRNSLSDQSASSRLFFSYDAAAAAGDSNVELVTTYKGEQVSVVFSITDFKNEDYDDDFEFDDDEDDEDEEEGEEAGAAKSKEEEDLEVDLEDYDDDEFESEPEPVIDFDVHVNKGSETLTFECTTDGSIYSINTVNMSNEAAAEDKIEYEGPNFEDLEENLQEGFFEYVQFLPLTHSHSHRTPAITQEKR